MPKTGLLELLNPLRWQNSLVVEKNDTNREDSFSILKLPTGTRTLPYVIEMVRAPTHLLESPALPSPFCSRKGSQIHR